MLPTGAPKLEEILLIEINAIAVVAD